MRTLLLLAALVLLPGVAACGGGGDSADSTAATPRDPATTTTSREGRAAEEAVDRGAEPKRDAAASRPERPSPAPVDHDDYGGGAQQFRSEGGDNSIQEFGAEAPSSDREEAAAALHGYLDAGVRRDWPAACRYLSRGIYEQLTAGQPGMPCAAVLRAFFAEVPSQAFADAAVADVGSLRVEGDRGFLLYHGAQDLDYQMPVALEGGRWKVAAAASSPLP